MSSVTKINLKKNEAPYQNQENFTCVDNVYVTQSTADGLFALCHWLDGYESAKGGKVPGHFELVMFLRELGAKVFAQQNKDKQNQGHEEFDGNGGDRDEQ